MSDEPRRPDEPEEPHEKFLRTFKETYDHLAPTLDDIKRQPMGKALERAAEVVGVRKVQDPELYAAAARCVERANLPDAVQMVGMQLAMQMLTDEGFGKDPDKREEYVAAALSGGLSMAAQGNPGDAAPPHPMEWQETDSGPRIAPQRDVETGRAYSKYAAADEAVGRTRFREAVDDNGRPAFEFSPLDESDIDFDDWKESVNTLANSDIERRDPHPQDGRPVYRVTGPLARRLLDEAKDEGNDTLGGLSTTLNAGADNPSFSMGPALGGHFAEPTRRGEFKQPTRWAGSPSWERAWQESLQGWRYEIRNDRWNAYGFTGALSAGAFEKAHALAILPEQASVLPRMSVDELVDEAINARLPFDPLYIDFTDEDGNCLSFDITDQLPADTVERLHAIARERRGALDSDRILGHCAGVMLWKEAGWGLRSSPGNEEKTPLCGAVFTVDNANTLAITGLWITSPEDRIAYGRFTDTRMPECQPLVSHSVAMYGNWGDADDESTRQRRERGEHACIIPALRQDEREEGAPAASRDMEAFKGVLTAAAMERAMAAIYLTQSANVELGETTHIHKRDLKRAEKRGWPIALTVFVRVPRRRTQRASEGNGSARDYTHRFDRIGHYKHVQKGPHVRCRVCLNKDEKRSSCERCHGTGLDPALVKPCTRRDETTGDLTCPHGCRREWHEPSVVGPEDKPYVPKARRVIGS